MKGFFSGERKSPQHQPHFIKTHAAPVYREEEEAKVKGPRRSLTGHAAAMAEYKIFKGAGMLAEWRERWRHVLNLRHH